MYAPSSLHLCTVWRVYSLATDEASLLFFPHQWIEFHQLRSVGGHSWEERKLYKTVFEYFLWQFPGERLMNFHLNKYFRISHLSQSFLIFLPPLPSCPFWYLAVHKVYIFLQFRISLFLSFSVSLTVSFRLACFGWDDLYFIIVQRVVDGGWGSKT